MNIQIYGKSKCFDTKKAERYFKERKIKFQMIDLPRFGMSVGEMQSVEHAVGGLDALIDFSAVGAQVLKYLALAEQKRENLLDNPKMFKTPIVRNGKQATIGYCPDIWEKWE